MVVYSQYVDVDFRSRVPVGIYSSKNASVYFHKLKSR